MKITIVGSGVDERRIVTEYSRKGRPGYDDPRSFDWEAFLADGDEERDPTGYGSSEENAIADLITQLEEHK